MLIKFFKIFFLKSNINIVDYIYLKIIEILTSKIQSQKNIINSIDNILKIKYKVDKWKVGKRVFLTDHYYNDDIKNNNKYKFYYINLEENINELSLKINGSLVIINGNDIFSTWGISKYNELVKRCPESIFVLYLYDNLILYRQQYQCNQIKLFL
jgi:ribosome biogenesis protein Nip4